MVRKSFFLLLFSRGQRRQVVYESRKSSLLGLGRRLAYNSRSKIKRTRCEKCFSFPFPREKKHKILTVLDSFCSKVERERDSGLHAHLERKRERRRDGHYELVNRAFLFVFSLALLWKFPRDNTEKCRRKIIISCRAKAIYTAGQQQQQRGSSIDARAHSRPPPIRNCLPFSLFFSSLPSHRLDAAGLIMCHSRQIRRNRSDWKSCLLQPGSRLFFFFLSTIFQCFIHLGNV